MADGALMAQDIPNDQLSPGAALRRKEALERFRQRSRAIHFWRRALPILIVSIAGLLFLWIGGRAAITRLTSPKSPTGSVVKMVNPRFYGRDSQNRAFIIGADQAARDMSTGRTVTFTKPSVTLDAEGAPTEVQADRGVYREDQRRLALVGKVQLTSARGYDFTTPKAVVDTSNGQVSGDAGVSGKGPLGRISASSYGVYDQGARIVMRGDVHAHIVQ